MPVLRTPNVHRRNRRRLGPGQISTSAVVFPVVTSTGTTNMRLTYSRPVVLRGNPTVTVATRTIVSSVLSAPNVVDVTMSGNVTGLAYTAAANDPNVSPVQGGAVIGAAGTFS